MMQTTIFHLEGLCCIEEERLVLKALRDGQTIHGVKINLIAKTVQVRHSCPREEVFGKLRSAGFRPRLYAVPKKRWKRYRDRILFFLSVVLLFLGVVLKDNGASLSVTGPMFLIVMIFSGWQVLVKAAAAIRYRSLDMNVLMIVAAAGASIIGRWEEGAAVMVLFSVSLLLEQYSIDRSHRAIRNLLRLSPSIVHLKRNGSVDEIEARDVRVGDHILLRPGERASLDGIVIEGVSMVDQAPITGESMPVEKNAGDEIYAGSLTCDGILLIVVTKTYSQTMLARIVQTVEESLAERAPIESFVDRFSRVYTPVVLGAAVLVAAIPPVVFHGSAVTWFYRALILIVIACPCALVIATPVALVSGMLRAARRGIVVKGGQFLEAAASIRAVAFDKTGTLTHGKPEIVEIVPLVSMAPEELLGIAAALESHSEHPIAKAFLRKAEQRGLSLREFNVDGPERLPGRGIRGMVQGVEYLLGGRAVMEEIVSDPESVNLKMKSIEERGETPIVLATRDTLLALFGVRDTLRPECGKALAALRRGGVETIVLLSGDSAETAAAIGREAGVEESHGGLFPEAKSLHVAALRDRYGSVAMVGDGVNDAPAFAAATVSIAMGSTGAELALQTADVALMTDNLEGLPYLLRLGKNTLRIIRQNIVLALAVKGVVVVLALFGWTSLWMAILADDGVTLLVILNSFRLLLPEFRSSGTTSR